MAKAKYVNEEQVKKALHIDSFRNLSKDKVMKFVSLIPNMDKEVAIAIINQFPHYESLAVNIVQELDAMCQKAMDCNSESQLEVLKAYKRILDDLGELLKDGELDAEEKERITDKMIQVADKMAAFDAENKKHIQDMFKIGASVVAGVAMLGAVILGVSKGDIELPDIGNIV